MKDLFKARNDLVVLLPFYAPNSNMGRQIRSAINRIEKIIYGPPRSPNKNNMWNNAVRQYLKNRRNQLNPFLSYKKFSHN